MLSLRPSRVSDGPRDFTLFFSFFTRKARSLGTSDGIDQGSRRNGARLLTDRLTLSLSHAAPSHLPQTRTKRKTQWRSTNSQSADLLRLVSESHWSGTYRSSHRLQACDGARKRYGGCCRRQPLLSGPAPAQRRCLINSHTEKETQRERERGERRQPTRTPPPFPPARASASSLPRDIPLPRIGPHHNRQRSPSLPT